MLPADRLMGVAHYLRMDLIHSYTEPSNEINTYAQSL